MKSGQLLFTIEPTDYAAAVAVGEGRRVARARVAQAHNKVQLERVPGPMKTGMVSQQDLDNATASLADADAQVQAAQAQLEQATLNLSYTQIRSPIDGVAGLALVRVGNLVGQDGPTLLTTVSQLDPIRVNFPMSESRLREYPDRFKQHRAARPRVGEKQFAKLESEGATEGGDPGVELVLSDGSTYAHRGVIVDGQSPDRCEHRDHPDPGPGAEPRRRAAPRAVRPGADRSGRTRARTCSSSPRRRSSPCKGTYSVGVVGPDNKVSCSRVEVGPSVAGLRVVTKGIAEGDRIVVEGVQKITDGAIVDPTPAPAGAGRAAGVGAPRA